MKILFATAEAYPFIKVGGLGDVAFALPKELRKLGIDVRIIMPKYSSIEPKLLEGSKKICDYNVEVGWRNQYCGIEYKEYDGIPIYFVDNMYYFNRPNVYGDYDDGEKFSFFSKAVVESISKINFIPDIIHCNDWHTAVIPLLLKYFHSDLGIKSVLTIHNLSYQGVFGKDVLGELLNLPNEFYSEDKMKYYDAVSFMKGGINYADKVTTVSPTYADEIKTAFYGEGLDGLLSSISYKLTGIVNGIDNDTYNPEIDKNIYSNFSKDNLEEKNKNKLSLQKDLGLTQDEKIPLITMVTRLVDQKGVELLGPIIGDLLYNDVQLVILGNGDPHYENMLRYYGEYYSDKLKVNVFYNNNLAMKIYAASDIYLMPSKFEPCGISQMIAQRYGSLPVVRETGGLKDTVVPYNKYLNLGDGFTFSNYASEDFLSAIKRALNLYYDKEKWNMIVQNAMKKDNGWKNSAKEYMNLYQSISN